MEFCCSCNKKIIFFLLSTLLLLLLLFTLHPILLTHDQNHYSFLMLRFQKTTIKNPNFNISPTPSPSPSPLSSPVPSPAPRHQLHRRSRHRLPLVTRSDGDAGGGGRRRRRVVVVVVVCAGGATCVVCVMVVFLLCKRKKKSLSRLHVKKVVVSDSDPIQKNFYLQSLGHVLDPPPICSVKQDQSDGSHRNHLVAQNSDYSNKVVEEDEHEHVFTENVDSIEPLKVDVDIEEDDTHVFGSPIAEEMMNVESHSSDDDDECFHSFCNSPHLSNPRISDVSISSDKLDPPKSTPLPPPPPPPPPPLSRPVNLPCTKLVSNFPKKLECDKQGSIPPPPLPPPVIGGKAQLAPPLPPPGPSTHLGKDGSPLPKLKPLHWDKVRAPPDRSMVWDKLRTSSFEFDEEMIESLFSYNLQNSNEELKSKSPSPSKHVLEPKRLQNLTILLKALNVTAEQVCCALVQGSGLNLQQLEVLIKMEPTQEEEAKLTGYKADIGSAETFVATIITIPYAFQRIQALLYRETFEDEVTHLRKTFLVLEEACKELRSSRLFLKLLEAVLKTGNRMNIGTIRGGAKAFKLDALLKLADVKGTDGKTTLLHFVVQEIVRSEGVRVSESIVGKINQQTNIQDIEQEYRNMGLQLVAGLSTELCNVKKTATIDFDVIASSVSNLSQGMSKLQRLVNQDLLLVDKSCGFGESMKSFINYAAKQLKELEDDERKVLQLVKQITEYFHGNMSKDEANPLRIFVTVRDFLGMLDLVCRELRRSKVCAHPNPLSPFQ